MEGGRDTYRRDRNPKTWSISYEVEESVDLRAVLKEHAHEFGCGHVGQRSFKLRERAWSAAWRA